METPVYLITGFLESGKTSFIKDTLGDEDFLAGERTLLLVCEEGDEEYDVEAYAKKNINVVYVEDEDDLTTEFLNECKKKYRPKKIMVEYNGMWKMEKIMEMDLPDNWVVVQIISLVDGSTFQMYMSNMRALLMEQVSLSDLVIFNRCDENTTKASFRRSIKATNRKAQIVFEGKDGEMLPDTEDDLPYDMTKDVIEIEDYDYGIFYLDAMDHPKKYAGKTIHFKAVVYKGKKFASNQFVPGRFAMTCCADDITFIGFMCNYENASELPLKAWVDVTAEIRVEFRKEYRGKGPVLYAKEVKAAQKPEEDLVYFN
ncbi:putative GTPase [Lachnospiraceae bacterium KM106-2]|nr:putative GTPase [Lachnospiraceae bacterium KM106-2]